MKAIRSSVFETNSSSVHTVTVKRNMSKKYDYNLGLNRKGKFLIQFAYNYNFACGPAKYNDARAKINYLACLAVQTYEERCFCKGKKGIQRPEDILGLTEIKRMERCIQKIIPGFAGFEILSLNDKDRKLFYFTDSGFLLYYSIDHQAFEDDYESVEDFLKQNRVSMENFIFNPCVQIIIDRE